MRLVLVFILDTNDQTNNESLPKFVEKDNAASSVKTANASSSINVENRSACCTCGSLV